MRMGKLLLVAAAVAWIAAAAQADLVLWYDFEETPGGTTVYDQSSYGNDGMLEAGYPASSAELPSYITSHDGSQALLFGYDSGVAGAGWNDVTVPHDASLGQIGNMWSMAFWARQDDNGPEWSGNYPRIISCPNYEIELGAEGDPASYFWPWEANPPYGDPASWDFGMAAAPYQSWFHMAVTFDGTTFTQYVNGSPVFTRTGMVPFETGTWTDPAYGWADVDGMGTPAPLRVGTQSWIDHRYLVGALDDVAIWGNAYLDADGVAALYSGAATPATVGAIPEPASFALLGLGYLLIRKKKD